MPGPLQFATLVFLSTRSFFLDVGSPVEMVLQHPISMPEDQVAQAIRDVEQEPVSVQPVAPRPQPVVTPGSNNPGDTCYTPGTPGTEPTVIPGPPGPDGTSGTPTVIPGIPPTPPSPHPCP